MIELFMIVGCFVVGSVATLIVTLIGILIADAVTCARFILRVRAAVVDSDDRISNRQLIKAWFRYWVGADWRPEYLTLVCNNSTIYWPGKEGSRRIPA